MAGSDHHHISPFCLLLNQLLLNSAVVNRWLTRKHAWLPRLFHLAFQWGRLEGPGCCPRDLGRGKEPHCLQPNQEAPEAARRPVLVWYSGFRKAHAQLLRRIQLFATPWTGAHQAPPSMGFPRPEYWSGRPCPAPRGLPDPGITPGSPALAGRFFTTKPPGKPHFREAGKDNYSPPWVCLRATWGHRADSLVRTALAVTAELGSIGAAEWEDDHESYLRGVPGTHLTSPSPLSNPILQMRKYRPLRLLLIIVGWGLGITRICLKWKYEGIVVQNPCQSYNILTYRVKWIHPQDWKGKPKHKIWCRSKSSFNEGKRLNRGNHSQWHPKFRKYSKPGWSSS